METPSGNCFDSPLFTFYVGPEKKAFHVHSQFLARISKSLNTLMNGTMSEAIAREVEWSDVDVQTFIRLCEFAYHEDYTCPRANIRVGCPSSHDLSIPVGSDLHLELARNCPEHTVTIGKTTLLKMGPMSCKLQYNEKNGWTENLRRAMAHATSPESYFAQKDIYEPPTNTSADEDFTPVFVEQARLYVLADMYGIEPLCHLVVSKLNITLMDYTLYPGSAKEIAEFVRFVYANTVPSTRSYVNPLRKLVTHYVTSILGLIGEYPEFQNLLRDGGDFVPDLFHLIEKMTDELYAPPVVPKDIK